MNGYFNKLYTTKNVWGVEPNKLIQFAIKYLKKNSQVLDLGCGQGRDALFLAQIGNIVTAVDSSKKALFDLTEQVKNQKLPITIINQSIEDYRIEPNKYSLIQIFNALQFLKHEDAIDVITPVKENIAPKGIIVISAFTTEDQSFSKLPKNCFFKNNELLKLFKKFEILLYKENEIIDQGHPGSEAPHKHGVVRLVARKI